MGNHNKGARLVKKSDNIIWVRIERPYNAEAEQGCERGPNKETSRHPGELSTTDI